MKKYILMLCFIISITAMNAQAQKTRNTSTSYGNTFNAGLGIGYYGYVGRSIPVIHLNYEFDVAKNFTLAPFISIYSVRNNYYWGNNNTPYRNYTYRETVLPIGVKGTYYLDQLVNAGSKWDFYGAGSLGIAIVSRTWESGYGGDRDYYKSASPLYLGLHVGTEYHFNSRIGAFLDLSTNGSSVGLAFH
jgi:hypothetical protein